MHYKTLYFILLASLASLNCMQPPQQTTDVYIKNDTGAEIIVTYQLRDMKTPVNLNIEPGQNYLIVNNADDLALLQVTPYGDVRGLIFAEKITFGLMKPENLAERIHTVRREAPHRPHIILTVKLKPGITASVKSYDYPIIAQDQKPTQKEPDIPFTFGFFPKVAAAFSEGKKIEPRYFLNLPENAKNDDIHMRYEQLMREWTPKLPASGTNPRDYTQDEFIAKEAVRFIKSAYDALMYPLKNRETYDSLIEEEIEAPTLLH